MTEPDPTLTIESTDGRSHRFVVVQRPGLQKMNLDAKIDGERAKSVCADLTFEQAHEIADFIKAHVPLPRKIHPDWAAIPVGARFGHYKDEAAALRRGKYPYVKVGKDTVQYSGEIRTAPEPNCFRLFVEPPTRREQVNALPDGTRFSCPTIEVKDPKRTTLEQIREQPLGVPFRIATFDYTYTRLAGGKLLYTDRFGNPTTIRPESEGGWGTCYYNTKEV